MLKYCEYCGKPIETPYPNKRFCNKSCAHSARLTRDESFYNFPHEPNAAPLFSFQCAECGKEVKIYSKYDQRTRFCCGICCAKFNQRQYRQRHSKQRYTSNLGMSGGMSLGSLIRRESRSVDKETAVEMKICPVCGKNFETDKHHKKYCSEACAAKAKAEYMQEYFKGYKRKDRL